MPATLAKAHLSFVICGHVDIGESTTTARLNYDLGGLPQREPEKLKEEVVCLVPGPIAFTFYMDRQKEEHECGVTSACTTQDFYTEKWHYTVVIDAPGHRNINKDEWYKDFEEKKTPAMPVSGWMGDYMLTKSDNMDLWKECVGEYGKEGRRVDFHNSFELILEEEQALDVEFFQQRLAQYQEVFPRYEFLGWYSIGKGPADSDHALHKKIQEVTSNENPFLLLLDTDGMGGEKAAQGLEELPVKVYDVASHIMGGELQVRRGLLPDQRASHARPALRTTRADILPMTFGLF
ncbi:unnamed protein product [Prorocentrum cordatum]|uniref:Tr-type G domain-containing protein n=1 Tax=Prorocentrum cordatum TaxID=2364126 RepID=A0ABN9WHQ7_9DINO|nr:unnamed protein product [Polarella glacialis]